MLTIPKDDGNLHDLLRKLRWYACLFDPIHVYFKESGSPALARQVSLKEHVEQLIGRCGNLDGSVDPMTAPKISGLPIAELLMGVCFDSWPWTDTGQ